MSNIKYSAGGSCCGCPPVRFPRIPDTASWHAGFHADVRDWSEQFFANGLPATPWTKGDDSLSISSASSALAYYRLGHFLSVPGPSQDTGGWRINFDLDGTGTLGILLGASDNSAAYIALQIDGQEVEAHSCGSAILRSQEHATLIPGNPPGEPYKVEIVSFNNNQASSFFLNSLDRDQQNMVQVFINDVEVFRSGMTVWSQTGLGPFGIGFSSGWEFERPPALPSGIDNYPPTIPSQPSNWNITKLEARPIRDEWTHPGGVPDECYVDVDESFRGNSEPLQTPATLTVSGVNGVTPAVLQNVCLLYTSPSPRD